MKYHLITLCAIASIALIGCQQTRGVEKTPAKLVQITESQHLRSVFETQLPAGRVAKKQHPKDKLDLQVATDGTIMVVAGRLGVVQGFQDGVSIWQIALGEAITSGVGYDAVTQVAIVTTRSGKVVALNAKTGEKYWEKDLGAVVLTPAIIVNNRVLLSANDSVIYGLVLQTGEMAWRHATQQPRISLRGAAKPVQIDANTVLFGTAEGRVYALSPMFGDVLWSRRVGMANAGGRIGDVDGTPLVVGNHLYITSVSGQLSGFDMATGQSLFTQTGLPTLHSVAWVDGVLVGVDINGVVHGFDMSTGVRLWQNDALQHRKLSNPVGVGHVVAVGDYEGVVHLLSKEGALVGRAKTHGQIISLNAHHNRLYAQTTTGRVAVWQLN